MERNGLLDMGPGGGLGPGDGGGQQGAGVEGEQGGGGRGREGGVRLGFAGDAVLSVVVANASDRYLRVWLARTAPTHPMPELLAGGVSGTGIGVGAGAGAGTVLGGLGVEGGDPLLALEPASAPEVLQPRGTVELHAVLQAPPLLLLSSLAPGVGGTPSQAAQVSRVCFREFLQPLSCERITSP